MKKGNTFVSFDTKHPIVQWTSHKKHNVSNISVIKLCTTCPVIPSPRSWFCLAYQRLNVSLSEITVCRHGCCRRCWNGKVPSDTLRNNNVGITSKRGHFDVITSKWRRFDVMATLLLRHVFSGVILCLPYRLYHVFISSYIYNSELIYFKQSNARYMHHNFICQLRFIQTASITAHINSTFRSEVRF